MDSCRPAIAQLNVAVTVVSPCKVKVQLELLFVHPPDQPPNDEDPTGVAVRVTGVPLEKLALQLAAVLAQLIPEGELVTVPEPLPAKTTVRIGPPPPLPVKHTTFAVIFAVTIAPDEDNPPALLFVVTVAETSEPPQAMPVAVSRPVGLTVNICVSFEAHVTWFVMSFVTGG